MYILPSSAIRVSMAARSARCSACVDAVSDTRGELAEVPAKMATKGMLMTMVMTMGAMVLAIYQTGPDAKSDTSMYSKSGPAKRVPLCAPCKQELRIWSSKAGATARENR